MSLDHSKFEITPTWTPDLDALARTTNMLGMTAPLSVEIATVSQLGLDGATFGRHRCPCVCNSPRCPHDTLHHIQIADWLDRSEANHTLWHELAHLSQFERNMLEGGAEHAFSELVAQHELYPYEVRPIEVEAREVADRFGYKIPLLREGAPTQRTFVIEPNRLAPTDLLR